MTRIHALSGPVLGFLSNHKWEIAKAAVSSSVVFFTCLGTDWVYDPCTNKRGIAIATAVNVLALAILHHFIQKKWASQWEEVRKRAESINTTKICRNKCETTREALETIKKQIKDCKLELEDVEKGEKIGLKKANLEQEERRDAAIKILNEKEDYIKKHLAELCNYIDKYEGQSETKKEELLSKDCNLGQYTNDINDELMNTSSIHQRKIEERDKLNAEIKTKREKLAELEKSKKKAEEDLIASRQKLHEHAATLALKVTRKKELDQIKEEKEKELAKVNCVYDNGRCDNESLSLSGINEQLRAKRFGVLKVAGVPDVAGSKSASAPDLIPSYKEQVGKFSEQEIAKHLWLGTDGSLEEYVQKVNDVSVYLHRQGFELRGVKANGNSFCSAFLKSYATLLGRSPHFDREPDKIHYLRNRIADEYIKSNRSTNGKLRGEQIKKDAVRLKATGEGDLLATPLDIAIRVVTVEKDEDQCSFRDMVTFPNKDEPQVWDKVDDFDKPFEYVLIVDLGGHFIAAQKIGSVPAFVLDNPGAEFLAPQLEDTPLELKGYNELVALQQALSLRKKQIDLTITQEKIALNNKINEIRELVLNQLKEELKELNDWESDLREISSKLGEKKKEAADESHPSNKKGGFFSSIGFSPQVSRANKDDPDKVEPFFRILNQLLGLCIQQVEQLISQIEENAKMKETKHFFSKDFKPFPMQFPAWADVQNYAWALSDVQNKFREEQLSKYARFIEDKGRLFFQTNELYELFRANGEISDHSVEKLQMKDVVNVLFAFKEIADKYQSFIKSKNNYFDHIKTSSFLEGEIERISKLVTNQSAEIEQLVTQKKEVEERLRGFLKISKDTNGKYAQFSGELGYIKEEIQKVVLDISGAQEEENKIKRDKVTYSDRVEEYSNQMAEIERQITENNSKLVEVQSEIDEAKAKKEYLSKLIDNEVFKTFEGIHIRYTTALGKVGKEGEGFKETKKTLEGRKQAANKAREILIRQRDAKVAELKEAEKELTNLMTERSKAQLKQLRFEVHTAATQKCQSAITLYRDRTPVSRLAAHEKMQSVLQKRVELALEKRKIILAAAELQDVDNLEPGRKAKEIDHKLKAAEARYKLALLRQESFQLNEAWRETKDTTLNGRIESLIGREEELTYQFYTSKLEYITIDKRDRCKRNANNALLNLVLAKMMIQVSRHQQNKPMALEFYSKLRTCLTECKNKYDELVTKRPDALEYAKLIEKLLVDLNTDEERFKATGEPNPNGLFYKQLMEYTNRDESIVNITIAKIKLVQHLCSKPYACDYAKEYENYVSKRDDYRTLKYTKKSAIESKESQYVTNKIVRKELKPEQKRDWRLEGVTYLAPAGALFALYATGLLNNLLPFGGILSYSAELTICKITAVVYLCLQSSFSSVTPHPEPLLKHSFSAG